MADGSVVIEITADDSEFRRVLESLGTAASQAAGGAEAAASQTAGTFISALAAAIAAAAPTAATAAMPIILALVTALANSGNPAMVQAAQGLIAALTGGIDSGRGSISAAGTAAADSFTQAVTGQSEQLRSAGANIVSGLLSGIRGAWSTLTSWVYSGISSLVSGVKGILGIRSPSKVFAELGAYTAQGFGEGFDRDFRRVRQDVESAASRLTGAVAAESAWAGTLLPSGTGSAAREVITNNNTVREKVVRVEADGGTDELIRLLGLKLKAEDRRVGGSLVE